MASVGVNVVQTSWSAYSQAFGEAMVLLFNHGDRQQMFRELRRARDALNTVLDHLPPEGMNEEADLARRIAEGVREHVDAIVQEVSATRQ